MTNQEIDRYFIISKKIYLDYSEAKFLYDKAGIDLDGKNPVISITDDFSAIMKAIMKNIEEDGLDYFMSKIDEKNNRSNGCILLSYSSRKDIIRYVLEKYDKGPEQGQIDSSIVIDLIIATQDKQLIKSVIESSEVREKYGIDFVYSDRIIDLIKAVNDSEYAEKIVKNFDLIVTHDMGNLEPHQVIELLELTENPNIAKHIIDDPEYGKKLFTDYLYRQYFGENYGKAKLIAITGDSEYIKEIIENKERREQIGFSEELDQYDITELLLGTKDPEYIKSVIDSKEKRKQIGFKIKNNEEKHLAILTLLEKINDVDYIKQLLENSKKRKEIGLVFDMNSIKKNYQDNPYIELIRLTKDPKYIKAILEDSKKRKKYHIDDKDFKVEKIGLIKGLNDLEYVKQLIFDEEKRKQIGLDTPEDLVSLIFLSKDENIISKFFEEENIEKQEDVKDEQSSSEITLPSNMTIGTEIEAEGFNSVFLRPDLVQGWECKSDGSLEDGVEIVSPILTGDLEKATYEIKSVCSVMKKCGLDVSNRCGAHVHIGADYLTSQESWSNLTEIWANCEEILYIISNKEGEIPREGVISYARPISSSLENIIEDTVSEDNIKEFVKNSQEGRFYGINFSNVDTSINTIEFRLANGTLDADTWIQNINLFGGIIKAAEQLSQIQQKDYIDITAEEKDILENFEVLKDEDISDEEKLDAFLKLTIPEEQRDVYARRYRVNRDLIEKNENIKDGITRNVAKTPIKLDEIKQRAFDMPDVVTASDYLFFTKFYSGERDKEDDERDWDF